ncbi:MAG: L,D-transpeptidase family protein [Thermodesulfobacteriota bacterium]|nr:L,D-transpeptidase family protein [Thermodesulfobacteriota bacterium]
MRKFEKIFIVLFIFGIQIFLSRSIFSETLSNKVRERLRNRIESAGIPPEIFVGDELIYSTVILPQFYERRTYYPAFIDDTGLLSQVNSLIKTISEADKEGLIPEDYHLSKINDILSNIQQNQKKKKPHNIGRFVDLDLLLTDAFLIYAAHLLAGRINPETIDSEWHANRREADIGEILQKSLELNKIEENLKGLLPSQEGYAMLRNALLHYREIALKGCWSSIPDGTKLKKGDRGTRVIALKASLIATGDLDKNLNISDDIFDGELEQAVKKFQKRHNLYVDGVVGPFTLSALNIPVDERIRQIELNMERWRWLPQDLGQRYILVNIANFELDVVENGRPVITMSVIVGTQYRRTPVFSDKMSYLVLNPYWHIPTSIAIKDKLILIRKDPAFLAKGNIKILQGWGTETKEIDPDTIDWSGITAKNFNYRLRQDPGHLNPLGRVKFMFPNKFDVYLHDTPFKELFTKTKRTFSSGCIRVEKPIDLAEYVLKPSPDWTRLNILTAMDNGTEQTIGLPEKIPVHILYWTAWSDKDGSVQFRNDIYGRDRLLDEAMSCKPPHFMDTK